MLDRLNTDDGAKDRMSKLTPQQGTIVANGLEFAFLELGEGPLVLCLHGFPDRAESFVPLLRALANAGYRAVAPYLRGYAPSGFAPDGDYSIGLLAQDVIALIDHFGADRASVVGHDWGAVAGYAAANLRPDRVDRLVTAAVPHLRRFLLRPTFAQLSRSSYMLAFQWPNAERKLMSNDFADLERRISRWSPGWMFAQQDWWIALKSAFREPRRLSAALAYYRALGRLLVDADLWRLATAPVSVPTRVIYGSRDGCIGAEMFANQDHLFTAGLDLQRVEAGHFMHQERPDEFARLVIEFLTPGAAAPGA